MGIVAALFAMTLLDKERWKGSREHPSTQIRIDATLRQMCGAKPCSAAAMACFSLGTLRRKWPDAPIPSDSIVETAERELRRLIGNV